MKRLAFLSALRGGSPARSVALVMLAGTFASGPVPAYATSGCKSSFGAPITCPGDRAQEHQGGGIKQATGAFPLPGMRILEPTDVPLPTRKPQGALLRDLEDIPLPIRKPGRPLPVSKPRMPPPMEVTSSDLAHLEGFDFWTSFRRNFARRMHEEFDLKEDVSLDFLLSLAITKFKAAGWKGNAGIETGLEQGLDAVRGDVDPDNPAFVMSQVGLLVSRSIAEEMLAKKVVPVIRSIPIVGDAAAGLTEGAVGVTLDGVEAGGVIMAITFFALQDALREDRERVTFLPREAAPEYQLTVPPRPPGENTSVTGMPLPQPQEDAENMRCTVTTYPGGMQIKFCLPRW